MTFMGFIETTWKPTRASVEKKNTKYDLASTIMEVWKVTDEIRDEDLKNRLTKILLRVL